MNIPVNLNAVIAKTIWWKKPEEALQDREQIIAYAMTYGTLDEVAFLMKTWGVPAFEAVLEHPPAGIFDIRSWHFWHLYLRRPIRSLPTRF